MSEPRARWWTAALLFLALALAACGSEGEATTTASPERDSPLYDVPGESTDKLPPQPGEGG